jgi:hypothetical protein
VAGRNLGVMIKGEKLRKKLAVESSSWFLIMSVKDVVTEMIKKTHISHSYDILFKTMSEEGERHRKCLHRLI